MVTSPPASIVCVDCGEIAHLLAVQGPDDEDRVAVYRCSGCWDRWDVVVEAEPARSPAGPAVSS